MQGAVEGGRAREHRMRGAHATPPQQDEQSLACQGVPACWPAPAPSVPRWAGWSRCASRSEPLRMQAWRGRGEAQTSGVAELVMAPCVGTDACASQPFMTAHCTAGKRPTRINLGAAARDHRIGNPGAVCPGLGGRGRHPSPGLRCCWGSQQLGGAHQKERGAAAAPPAPH